MSAVAYLADLVSRGLTVRADGETLRLKPKAALDDGLLAWVQAHKPDILAVLSGRVPRKRQDCEVGPMNGPGNLRSGAVHDVCLPADLGWCEQRNALQEDGRETK